MSRRANLLETVGQFCTKNNIKLEDALEFAFDVLEDAGQISIDQDDGNEILIEKNEIKHDLRFIYARMKEVAKVEKEQ
jgi:hypothetical protein